MALQTAGFVTALDEPGRIDESGQEH